VSLAVLTVAEVADLLGVCEGTVLGWLARKELRGVNVGTVSGKKKPRWRVTAAELDRFLAARQADPGPEKPRRVQADRKVIPFH
jgi:excisionase family DNA binding protein